MPARALLSDAVDRGVRLLARTQVEALLQRDGRVAGLVTDDGTVLEADETVIAAGTGSSGLLATVGASIAMTSPPGLIAHSTVVPKRLLNGMVMSPDFHVRQTREGRLIAGSDFAGADPGTDADATGQALLALVRQGISGAEETGLAFATVGNRPTPADGYPAIGRPGGMPGLYPAVMHSGVTLAPLVGELAARELVGGERDPDLARYDPDRPELR